MISIQRRGLCIAYFSILLVIGTFLGSALGGLILQKYDIFNLALNKFFAIFILSAFLRALAGVILLPKIKEVRRVRKFHPIISFGNLGITHKVKHHLVHDTHVAEEKIKNNFKS